MVRTFPSLSAGRSVFRAVRRGAGILREAALLAGFVALIELARPYATHDGKDLIVLVGALLLGMLLAKAAQSGWLPATCRLGAAIKRRGARIVARLSPRYAVAFRPSESARALPDRTLWAPILVLAGLTVAVLLLGKHTGVLRHYLFEGLLFVKLSVSYTLYLALLALLWSALALTALIGSRVAANWLAESTRAPGSSAHLPLIILGVLWVAGLAALLALPGIAALVALLAIGWLRGRTLSNMPARSYLFCRRDAEGRPRAVPVHRYLRRIHTGMVALLALIVVLAQSQRLWLAEWPAGPFAFTTWLGILASLMALLLVARAGVHFNRLLGGGGIPPEVPLTPTLWIRTPEGAAGATDEWARSEAWYHVARDNGWLALRDARPPEHEYDLVMGVDSDPRRFKPRPPSDEKDASFQLERRLHIVMRRRFRRSFEGLFKRLRAETPEEGTGYLFCPHIWLVPGVVRDVEPGQRTQQQDSNSTLGSGGFYGPPYAAAFPNRVRRYVGSILRDLQVDIIYWEDAIQWRDLRRVLGVAYEIHDQGRGPALERHFIGIPRVRIVIQEEAAEPEPSRSWLEGGKPSFDEVAPGHARILLVLRDRGKNEEAEAPDPVDSWIKTPSLV